MVLIIAGTRSVTDPAVLENALAACGRSEPGAEVVSGCEPDGVDRLGERWAAAGVHPGASVPG